MLYINDLHDVVSHSELSVFADDVALFREICSSSDCDLLQEDLNNIGCWSECWQLRLSPSKCEALSISNKRLSLSQLPIVWIMYQLYGVHTSVHYLGLTITSNMCWTNHCKIISAKATRCLNFLRHTLWGATPFVKSIAYRCVVNPLLEYGCQLWNPFTTTNIQLLEQNQRRAARWVCNSRWDPFGLSHLINV